MTRFEEQLLRLKECLGVSKDVQVAEAIGLSRAAFSNRKQLGSFPEEHVVALKREYPDLDVMYVLTGQRWTAGELSWQNVMFTEAAKSGDRKMASSVARAARNHVQALKDAAEDPQVRELLGVLIFCDRPAIAQVITFAARLMGRDALLFGDREPPEGRLLGAPSARSLAPALAEVPQRTGATVGEIDARPKPRAGLRKRGRKSADELVLRDEVHRSAPLQPGKMSATAALLKELGETRVVVVTATQKRAVAGLTKTVPGSRRRTTKVE